MVREPVSDALARLPGLLEGVRRARARDAVERATGAGPLGKFVARAELLDALECYASALLATHRPLPYALRDELHLRRRLRASPYQR